MNDLEELKTLLFGAEKQILDSITERVATPETRAGDIADVLPEAVARSHSKGPEFVAALRKPVDECTKKSIRADPQGYADVLYPVMGPAIRKSITHALRAFTQQMNETVENSLSLKGLKWRFEAWRSGVPFVDYVLQQNMLYRIEQAYLISRDNGLLVAHAHSDASQIKDSDAVSAMFTAIQDFIEESFSPDRSGRLETADMGEFTLWAVHGPHALLVCVIRGIPPRALRGDLSVILERIHFRYGDSLREYAGDATTMQGVEDELSACLEFEALRPADSKSGGLSTPILVVLLLIAAAIIYFGFAAWQEARQRQTLANELAGTPGYYVAGVDVHDRTFVVRGLQDPLATSLTDVAATAGIDPDRVRGELRPYQSLDADILLARARAAIDPPPGVDISVADEKLVISGMASQEWVDTLRASRALHLLGAAVDLTSLISASPPEPSQSDPLPGLQRRVARMAQSDYYFASGANLREPDAVRLTGFAATLRELADAAAEAGTRLRVDVVGYTDSIGSPEANARLGERRAEAAAQVLTQSGLEPELIRRSAAAETSESDTADPALRRVTILLSLQPSDAAAVE